MEGKKVKHQQNNAYIPPVLFTNTNQFMNNPNNPSTRLATGNSNLNKIVIGEQPNNCYICFNPYCTLPYSRIFQLNHAHKNVQACYKWMIGVNELGRIVQPPKNRNHQKVQINCLEFDTTKNQINSTIKSWKLSQSVDWTKYLLNYKNVFMTKIEQEFNQILLNIKNKVAMLKSQEVVQNLSDLYNNIVKKQKNQVQLRKFMEYIIEQYIKPVTDKSITIKCPDLQDLDLPSLTPLTSSLMQKIITQKEQGMKYSVVSQQNHEQFQQFMLNDSAPFNKLQQISSMCGNKCDQYIIKSRGMSLKCPFCPHVQKEKLSATRTEQQMKMIKKQLAVEVLTHCFNCHYSFIYSKYEGKRLKKPFRNSNKFNNYQSRQITFQQLITELQSNSYTKLHIYDRETGIPNPTTAIKSQPNTFKLEIVSKNNRTMAKMNYILTPDRKCTQFMINYITVYVCLVQRLLDIDDICIESNCRDINRIQNLKLMLLGSGVNFSKKNQRIQQQDPLNSRNMIKSQRYNLRLEEEGSQNFNFFDLHPPCLLNFNQDDKEDERYQNDSQQGQLSQEEQQQSPLPKIEQAVLQQRTQVRDPRILLKQQKQLQNKNEGNKQKLQPKVKIQQ